MNAGFLEVPTEALFGLGSVPGVLEIFQALASVLQGSWAYKTSGVSAEKA